MNKLTVIAFLLTLSPLIADVMVETGGTPYNRPPIEEKNEFLLPIQNDAEIIQAFAKKYTALGKPDTLLEFGAQDLYLQAAFEKPLITAGVKIIGVKTPASPKPQPTDPKPDLIIHVNIDQEIVPIYKPSGQDEKAPRWHLAVSATRLQKDGTATLLSRVDSDRLFSLEGAPVGIRARHVLHVSPPDLASQTCLDLLRQISAQ